MRYIFSVLFCFMMLLPAEAYDIDAHLATQGIKHNPADFIWLVIFSLTAPTGFLIILFSKEIREPARRILLILVGTAAFFTILIAVPSFMEFWRAS